MIDSRPQLCPSCARSLDVMDARSMESHGLCSWCFATQPKPVEPTVAILRAVRGSDR
jgi:hypothetical protein